MQRRTLLAALATAGAIPLLARSAAPTASPWRDPLDVAATPSPLAAKGALFGLARSRSRIIAVGQRADLNVLDAASVAEQQPELVNDFPGGAARFIQRATGYKATIVNGVVNVENGEHTGARAGAVLRHAPLSS